jgi:DNA repair protein RecO (recombination protein O)
MPHYTAEALVLRTYDFGEADRIVVFLTRDRGKKRGVARSARRSRRRFGGALEPFTCVEASYFEKEHRELVVLNSAAIMRSPLEAPDPDALGYAEYFAELIDEWAPDADPNERLFRLGAAVVDAMAGGVAVQRLARYFEYWLLRLQGVYPSSAACQRCDRPLAGDGAWLSRPGHVLLCRRCGDAAAPVLSPDAIEFLRLAASIPPDQLSRLELTPAAGRELERLHRVLVAVHLEREPRSSRVLREMAAPCAGRDW